jgi:hypothetical protein
MRSHGAIQRMCQCPSISQDRQIHQTNQTDETDQMNQKNRMSLFCLLEICDIPSLLQHVDMDHNLNRFIRMRHFEETIPALT